MREGLAGRILSVLALAILPILVSWVGAKERLARGAMWLFSNPDPDFAYLLNALTVATGGQAAHPDHPGVPIKVGAAFVLKAISWADDLDVVNLTLLQPDATLELLQGVMGWGVATVILVAGVVLSRTSAGLTGALFVQSVSVGSIELLQRSTRLCPEPVLFILAVGLTVILWVSLVPDLSQRRQRLLCAGAILLAALGVATKLTFLPLVVLPALRWSTGPLAALVKAAVTLALAFAICLPVEASPLGSVFFVATMAGQGGLYGTGAPAKVSLADAPAQAAELFSLLVRHEPIALLVLGASLVLAFAILRRWRATSTPVTDVERLLLIVVLAEGMQLAMVLRQPSIRYAVPTIGLLGLNLLLAWALLRRRRLALSRRIMSVCAVGATATIAIQLFAEVRDTKARAAEAASRAEVTEAAVSTIRARGCVVAPFYGASTPEFALLFGDRFAGQAWGQTLQSHTPGFIFLNTVSMSFGSYAGEYDEHFLSDFGIEHRCLVLFGPLDQLPPLPVPSVPLGVVWGTEGFVRVLPSNGSSP